jgi:hypothetical protein
MIDCPLCEKTVPKLHRRSHILPRWSETYDKTGPRTQIHMDAVGLKEETLQTGKIASIVCPGCEVGFGKYDNYACQLIGPRRGESRATKNVRIVPIPSTKKKAFIGALWRGIDFTLLQKFVFCCVLRSHFNHLKETREGILSDRDANGIRSLYRGKLLDDVTYPFYMHELFDDDDVHLMNFLPFNAGPIQGHECIRFQCAGFQFGVWVSNKPKQRAIMETRLKMSGEILVPLVQFQGSSLHLQALEMLGAIKEAKLKSPVKKKR